MPKVKNVEKKIWDIEGFDITFLHADGRNVHGALANIPQYPYVNAAANDRTVTEWKTKRFAMTYPGFEVQVIDGNGNQAHGATKLGTVRDSYTDDED